MVAARNDLPIPQVQLRPMTEEDLARVSAVERESYAFPWSEGIFRDCLRVGYVCRVVEIGFDLVGYAVMSTGAGEAHILNLCVRETMRGRGIGRTLLRQLLDLAAEMQGGPREEVGDGGQRRTCGLDRADLQERPCVVALVRVGDG